MRIGSATQDKRAVGDTVLEVTLKMVQPVQVDAAAEAKRYDETVGAMELPNAVDVTDRQQEAEFTHDAVEGYGVWLLSWLVRLRGTVLLALLLAMLWRREFESAVIVACDHLCVSRRAPRCLGNQTQDTETRVTEEYA